MMLLHIPTLMLALLLGFLLLPGVGVILRHGWRAERALRAVALTMAVAVVALLLRAVQALLQPENDGAPVQASLGQGLMFLVAFVCLLGAGFGFIRAVFGRTGGEEFGLVLPATSVAGARWLV